MRALARSSSRGIVPGVRMVGDNSSESNRQGPSGPFALALVAGGLFLAFCCWPAPQYFRPPEYPLLEQAGWGVVMTLALVVSIASIRRGSPQRRWTAHLAFIICLVSIGSVVVNLGQVLLLGR
jgi:hypothetical protein